MEYEIAAMPERITMGITARTNNSAPDMGSVIGGLWTDFYAKGYFDKIPGNKKSTVLGIYSDYDNDETGDYDLTVACDISREEAAPESVPEGMTVKVIPAGNYAKFVIHGDVQKAVGEFWQELWQMNLKRTFVADYEEYMDDDMENGEIHIYIGLADPA